MSLTDLIPPQYRLAAMAAAFVAAVGVGFGGGWTVNGWRLGAALEAAKGAHEADKAQALAATVRQLITASADRDALAAQLADLDKNATADLKRLTNENETLRGRVAAGTVRVRVNGAVCPGAQPADVPQAPAGSGVDTGTGAVLTADAGRSVFNLRAAAIREGSKLAACQAALGRLTGQLSPE